MKTTLLIAPILLTMTACNTINSKKVALDYIDLSKQEQQNQLEKYWTLKKNIPPVYPVSAAANGKSGCVDVVFGINPEGKMEGYSIRSSYPKGVFDDAAVIAVSKWRWEPTRDNVAKKPVLTSVRLDFMLLKDANDAQFLANCPMAHS